MRAFGRRFRKNWLSAAIVVGSAVAVPIAASSGQIFYRAYLTASLTVSAAPAVMSVSRAAGGEGPASGVTINSRGAVPYTFFIEQTRAAALALQFCRDPACTTVWAAPNGDPQTGILVTPGSASTALPLTVVRAANAADDGSISDVVMLTMYF